ncbi:hypothetical protein CH63R_05990 [Colletotrichum higginsianum IMI 349063]|uniref:Uncharacterized protein n=1 Tax=Colletotrichum higginsianum (strain IMI 349063) TaxID=759273 RepID=A0A1B7YEP6_COLHI|nr:hypothetical protein CH63R_05990 [Colletotrichum higginsianum IMI 349063]OBR10298.1 hypothetical protein CH63R_05990 [Colletotrichum higginsianum IMI 349063]
MSETRVFVARAEMQQVRTATERKTKARERLRRWTVEKKVSGEIDRLLTKIDDGTKRTSPRNGTLERKHLSSFF